VGARRRRCAGRGWRGCDHGGGGLVAHAASLAPAQVLGDGHRGQGLLEQGGAAVQGRDVIHLLSGPVAPARWGPGPQATGGDGVGVGPGQLARTHRVVAAVLQGLDQAPQEARAAGDGVVHREEHVVPAGLLHGALPRETVPQPGGAQHPGLRQLWTVQGSGAVVHHQQLHLEVLGGQRPEPDGDLPVAGDDHADLRGVPRRRRGRQEGLEGRGELLVPGAHAVAQGHDVVEPDLRRGGAPELEGDGLALDEGLMHALALAMIEVVDLHGFLHSSPIRSEVSTGPPALDLC
jgi:hypothetical protein